MFNIDLNTNSINKKMTFSESPFGKANGSGSSILFHKNTSNFHQIIYIYRTASNFTIEASNNNGNSWVRIVNVYSSNNSSIDWFCFILPKWYWLRNANNNPGDFTGYVEQLNY